MSAQDELIRQAVTDLRRLRSKLPAVVDSQDELEDVKDECGRLRRLLIDPCDRWAGTYERAWHAIGLPGMPSVVAPDLAGKLGIDLPHVRFAASSGANLNGVTLALPVLFDRAKAPAELRAAASEGAAFLAVTTPLYEFRDGASIVYQGEKIRRRDVIRFAAHELGAVQDEAGSRSDEPTHRLLSDLHENFRILGVRPVFNEILAYATQLFASPDTALFLERAAASLSPTGPRGVGVGR
jgi:hypothetical protein